MTTQNFWYENAGRLTLAYTEKAESIAGRVRFGVVTRGILNHTSGAPRRILDIGGGYGEQALALARLGHRVDIADPDESMLNIASEKFGRESASVRRAVRFLHCAGEDLSSLALGLYDVVCCHSVVMYLADPTSLIRNAAQLTKTGGLISILSLNIDAMAMRAGLLGNWEEAITSIKFPDREAGPYLKSKQHSKCRIEEILLSAGASIIDWYGVGVFTDHRRERFSDSEYEQIIEAEWLAGKLDPYRQIARQFHILSEKSPS
jgi:S-adenosylmethionine-dependent methyltransferase